MTPEKKSKIWERLANATGAKNAQPTQVPATNAQPPTQDPDNVVTKTPDPKEVKKALGLGDQLNSPAHQAKVIAQNSPEKVQQIKTAIEKIENYIDVLSKKTGGAIQADWKDVIDKINFEKEKINNLKGDLNLSHENLPRGDTAEIKTLEKNIRDSNTASTEAVHDLDKMLKTIAPLRNAAPRDNALATRISTRPIGSAHLASSPATLNAALLESAHKAGFGKEVAEACGRLKEKIDTKVVVLMEMMNVALGIASDGRAYSYNPSTDVITVNKQDPDLISRFTATEAVTRELEAAVTSMPEVIESLIITLDEAHSEFVSIVTGEPPMPVKRTFAPPISVKPPDRAHIPIRSAEPIEASLQAAMGATADRAAFIKKLVETSGRLKEHIDSKVLSLLGMMNNALNKGIGDAYAHDVIADKIVPIMQPDLVFGFTTTERVTRELAEAVKDMPQEIEALIQELLRADEEFNKIIVEELNKK
jgi:hypothetical protein